MTGTGLQSSMFAAALFAEKEEQHAAADVRTVNIMDLKPTQMAIGEAAVDEKKERMEGKTPEKLQKYLDENMMPVVVGPDGKLYMIDHHHLACAMLDMKPPITQAKVVVVDDLSKFKGEEFWQQMEAKNYAHPYDKDGKRHPFSDIPPDVTKLEDDPYRSLAGLARRAGAYAKSEAPFAEFKWADFLRQHISKDEISKDFDKALQKAIDLAHKPEAAALPGYSATPLPPEDKQKKPDDKPKKSKAIAPA